MASSKNTVKLDTIKLDIIAVQVTKLTTTSKIPNISQLHTDRVELLTYIKPNIIFTDLNKHTHQHQHKKQMVRIHTVANLYISPQDAHYTTLDMEHSKLDNTSQILKIPYL